MTISISLDLETWGTTPGSDIRSIGACVFDPLTGDVSIPCQTCKGGTTRGNVNDGGDCSDCMNTRMERGYGDTFYIACDNPQDVDRSDVFLYAEHGIDDANIVWSDEGTFTYQKYPLTRDPRTVRWWSEQSSEAQAAFADPVDLRVVLVRFTGWLKSLCYACGGSGRTPDFDTSDEGGYFVDCYECGGDSTKINIRLWSHGAAFDPPILAAAYDAVGLPVPWHYRAPRDTRTLFDAAGIEDHSALLARHSGDDRVQHHALSDAICQARAVCAAYSRLRSPDREFHVGRIAMQQYANWTNQAQDIGGAWAEIERAIQET